MILCIFILSRINFCLNQRQFNYDKEDDDYDDDDKRSLSGVLNATLT